MTERPWWAAAIGLALLFAGLAIVLVVANHVHLEVSMRICLAIGYVIAYTGGYFNGRGWKND